MRWQSRFAIGAALLLPTLGFAGTVAAAGSTAAPGRPAGALDGSVSTRHSTQSAVIANESGRDRPMPTLRPVVGALPAHSPLLLAAWALVAIVGALALSVPRLRAVRVRAPPLRFL